MKVNGNHKNNSNINSEESKTDLLSKKAVAKVDEIPVKHFDAAKTWEKLSAQLGQMDKRFVTWGLAMAASLSLLVAANIEIFNWDQLEIQPKEKHVATIQKVDKKEITPIRITPIVNSLESIKTIQPIKAVETPIKTDIRSKRKSVLVLDKKEQDELEVVSLSNPFVSIFAKANFQSTGITPEIGIDFKLAENYTAKRRNIYKLGVSSQLNFETNESGEKKVHPHTFVNLEFTSLNKKTNKGWTGRAGYLLNPNNQLYQDTTIKVSLFRNVGKHIKVGPEVIFTDNMKKAYPSISLILG